MIKIPPLGKVVIEMKLCVCLFLSHSALAA